MAFADIIWFLEMLLKHAVAEEEEFITVRTTHLVVILELLKRAKKPHGRQRISGRARVQESLVISLARARKAELIAKGMPRGKATDQAAEEAAAKLGKTRNLSLATIKRRMQRR
jgi:hypothetical protein